jgi:hypothetical protein
MSWEAVTAISGIASALFTAVAGGAAVYAATTWLKGLKNERIDNALSAVHDLDRIDRVVAIRGGESPEQRKLLWKSYNEAWDSRSRFNQAYVVAQRYDEGLQQFNAPNEATERMKELQIIAERGNQYSKEDADKFQGEVDDLVRRTADALRAAAQHRLSEMNRVLNLTGLGLSLVGVVTLFYFGMPFHVPTGGAEILAADKLDPAMIALEQRYMVYGYIGLLCLIVGTGFQAIAAWRAD